MSTCDKCKSPNIVPGKITTYGHSTPAKVSFTPDRLRFFEFSVSGGTEISQQIYACLDCGFVGAQTDQRSLKELVEKHCKPAP
jgi:hypothetical protein